MPFWMKIFGSPESWHTSSGNILYSHCQHCAALSRARSYADLFQNLQLLFQLLHQCGEPAVLQTFSSNSTFHEAKVCYYTRWISNYVTPVVSMDGSRYSTKIIELNYFIPQSDRTIIWSTIERTCVCSVHAQNNYALR